METVESLEQQMRERSLQAITLFTTLCSDYGLNETSQAQLLGVSRQTMVNYKKGTVPCRGVTSRIKIVVPLLKAAHDSNLLPAAQSRKQGELVKAILNQPA
jgi:DNA-binding XRE family transcriptional regulator